MPEGNKVLLACLLACLLGVWQHLLSLRLSLSLSLCLSLSLLTESEGAGGPLPALSPRTRAQTCGSRQGPSTPMRGSPHQLA